MSELKIGKVGRVNGQVVKCVKSAFLCNGCIFIEIPSCMQMKCTSFHRRKDLSNVIFIAPTPEEVRAFEEKEGGK